MHRQRLSGVTVMSLLEDLKKEAEAKKEKELEAQRRQEQALEEFRTEVRPRLAQVFTYLSELVEHLNFVHPDIQVSYAIKNYANLENLRQSGYTVHADNQGDLKSISLSCECTGDRKVGFEVTSEALMTRENPARVSLSEFLAICPFPLHSDRILRKLLTNRPRGLIPLSQKERGNK